LRLSVACTRRIRPRELADPDLAQREGELIRERAVHVLGQLRDRAVEAQPGLDAHCHQVECVRKLGADRILARPGLGRNGEVRADETESAQRDRAEEHACAGAGRGAAEDGTEHEPANREGGLEREERRGRHRAPEARGEQARADPVDRRLRVELQCPVCEAVAERADDAHLERLLNPPKRRAEGAVPRRAAHRALALAGRGHHGVAEEVGRGREAEESEHHHEQHSLPPERDDLLE
jgi:hypothetical protein